MPFLARREPVETERIHHAMMVALRMFILL
jgi:hypothetical protein